MASNTEAQANDELSGGGYGQTRDLAQSSPWPFGNCQPGQTHCRRRDEDIHRLASTASPWSMVVATVLLCLVSLLGAASSHAGVMTRESIEKIFPPPMIVGEKDSELPVWPILKDDGKRETPLIG